MSAADRQGRGPRRRASAAEQDPLGDDAALANLLAAGTPASTRQPLQPPPAIPGTAALGSLTPPAPTAAPGLALAAVPTEPTAELAAEPDRADGPENDPLLTGPHTGQATVAISVDVARRFRSYQNQRAARGSGQRPSNGEIVFAALNASQGQFGQIVADRQPKPAAGQLFGAPVPGRRSTSGAQPTQQLSFRPTPPEKALIARLARENGAASMAAFLNAVLDHWLAQQGFPPGKATAHT